MKQILKLLFLLIPIYATSQNTDTSIINKSRKSTLKILGIDHDTIKSIGSGFFVKVKNDVFVITCAHVVYKEKINGNTITWPLYDTIIGITYYGDRIKLSHVSLDVGNKITIENVNYDYSVFICDKLPKNISKLNISEKEKSYVGESVYFSGYPINSPLLTHTGMISGWNQDSSQIFVQSPINKGNSGGALLNSKGNVIGIVSFKYWNLSLDFKKYLSIFKTDPNGGMSITQQIGNEIIQTQGQEFNGKLIETLNNNLNTGIGGATNIKFVKQRLH